MIKKFLTILLGIFLLANAATAEKTIVFDFTAEELKTLQVKRRPWIHWFKNNGIECKGWSRTARLIRRKSR